MIESHNGSARDQEAATADAAEQLFFDHWYGISETDAVAIVTAAKALTSEELMARPMLITGALVALQLHTRTATAGHAEGFERFTAVMSQTPEPRAMRLLSATRKRQWLTMAMISQRWQGNFDEALEISHQLGAGAASGEISDMIFAGTRDSLWPGHLTLQRGISEALGGHLSTALALFTRAYDEGGEPPYWHFAKANAAANAAMICAVEGHIEAAQDWIGKADAYDPVPAPIQHLTFLGRDIAVALLAIDAGRLDEARVLLEPLGAASRSFELWPFLLYAMTELDLAENKPISALERLKAAGFQRDRITAIDPVADHLVFRAYLDTLVQVGEGGIALRLAKDLGHPLRSLVPVALVHLYAGDYTSASRVASQALRRALISRRDVWEANLIHALAMQALSETGSALEAFAVLQNSDAPFLSAMLDRAPENLLDELHGAAGIDAPTRKTSPPTAPPRTAITVPKLTSREHEVLQQLAENVTPAQIAEAGQTSEHTVRTHIKSIYKKLGATKKQDAIRRAEQLGLLQWYHLDGKNQAL